VLKCSNLFNTLDARGAISVTERVGVIGRVRKLAVGVAERGSISRRSRRARQRCGMNLLLEIGCEEIPDWMLAGALEYLDGAIGSLIKQRKLGDATIRTDATPRRLVVRAEGILEREPDSEERVWGPAKSAPEAGRRGLRQKAGTRPRHLEILSDGKVEKYSYIRKTEGRAANRYSRRSAAATRSENPVSENHVLAGQRRSALHPSHPLDRCAARR
jgi:glycyl-tRNA synthetase